MTYYAQVTVTKAFDSEKEANEFTEKIVAPIRGAADYTKSVRYWNPKSYSNGMKPSDTYITMNNPVLEDGATSVQKRVTRLEQMGMTNG